MKEKIKKEKYDIDMWGNIVKRPPSKSEIVGKIDVMPGDSNAVKKLIGKLMFAKGQIRMIESAMRQKTSDFRSVLNSAALTEIKI